MFFCGNKKCSGDVSEPLHEKFAETSRSLNSINRGDLGEVDVDLNVQDMTRFLQSNFEHFQSLAKDPGAHKYKYVESLQCLNESRQNLINATLARQFRAHFQPNDLSDENSEHTLKGSCDDWETETFSPAHDEEFFQKVERICRETLDHLDNYYPQSKYLPGVRSTMKKAINSCLKTPCASEKTQKLIICLEEINKVQNLLLDKKI